MKDKGLHVLLVEDNAGDARLLREMFSTEKPGSFELTHLLCMGAQDYLIKGQIENRALPRALHHAGTPSSTLLDPPQGAPTAN